MSDVTVIVSGGDEIAVGAKVHTHGASPVGEVVGISDPDVDVDDDTGRPYGVSPRVTVRWPGGGEDEFLASSTAQGWWDEDAAWECEDLVVFVPPAPRPARPDYDSRIDYPERYMSDDVWSI